MANTWHTIPASYARQMRLDQLDQIDTVFLDEAAGTPCVGAIDQTLLPTELVVERLASLPEVWRAIKRLEVRGAPAIGVAAALGAYCEAERLLREEFADSPNDMAGFLGRFDAGCAYLESSRPTAVNLAWALRRMARAARAARKASAGQAAGAERGGAAAADGVSTAGDPAEAGCIGVPGAVAALRAEALAIRDEDVQACRAIGEHGLRLLCDQLGGRLRRRDGQGCASAGAGADAGADENGRAAVGILTHCNAGRLATVRYGTATAPLYVAREEGFDLRVYCDETRPLLQGARLTAFELSSSGFDTTLICDNMSASMMRAGLVQAVFVGCDRVAANGDTANKVGTSMVALAARRYGVPFYVCAPTSTIDLATPTGRDIPIEERSGDEVTDLWYARRMAPEGVGVRNPAFDVTDADLVTAFVTERGVVRPPYDATLRACME